MALKSKTCDGDLFIDKEKYVSDDGRLKYKYHSDPKMVQIINGNDENDDWFEWDSVKRKEQGLNSMKEMPDIEGICVAGKNGRVNRLALYTYYCGQGQKPSFEDLKLKRVRPAFEDAKLEPNPYQPGNVKWMPTPAQQQQQDAPKEVVDDDHEDGKVADQFKLMRMVDQTLTSLKGFVIQGVEVNLVNEDTATTITMRHGTEHRDASKA